MNLDGKMSFDFFENLENHSNMQHMREVNYLRLFEMFANKLQISLKYTI